MTSALAAFAHHVLAFVLFAALMVELVLLRDPPTVASARSLLRMDRIYGICSMLILVVGFARVFHTEKGAAYYFASGPFMAKMALFVIVGLLSIHPTRTFLGWRKSLAADSAPVLAPAAHRRLKTFVHAELTLLVLMMLSAALMARGIGLFS